MKRYSATVLHLSKGKENIMTIKRLSELLNALTSTGAVDEDAEIDISIPDESLIVERGYSVIGVTISNSGEVILNGWEK